jgi:hypothetical protein
MASEIELKAAFSKLKFIECSEKGQNHWFEVLDPTWDFNNYDYRIPSSYSKSTSDMMSDQINRLTKF